MPPVQVALGKTSCLAKKEAYPAPVPHKRKSSHARANQMFLLPSWVVVACLSTPLSVRRATAESPRHWGSRTYPPHPGSTPMPSGVAPGGPLRGVLRGSWLMVDIIPNIVVLNLENRCYRAFCSTSAICRSYRLFLPVHLLLTPQLGHSCPIAWSTNAISLYMERTQSCATLYVPTNEIVEGFTYADPVRTYIIILS